MSDGRILGIDIGSVAIGVAVVSTGKEIVHTGYRFHRGDIAGSLAQLLTDRTLAAIDHVVATASTPALVHVQKRYNNEIAFIAAAKYLHPEMRALLLVGGEKFSLASFDADGHYLGSTSNTSCAAGTGSFLDQQAGRLNLTGIEELSNVAYSCSGDCPKIASRCAVFAKTDLIHAQQEGYQLAEISDGLCFGLAKNIVDTLFIPGRCPEGEVLFCGGVAKNRAVAKHITSLSSTSLTIPELGHLYGAIGACYTFIDEGSGGEEVVRLDLPNVAGLLNNRARKKQNYYYPPLQLVLSEYPDFTSVEQYKTCENGDTPVEVDVYRVLSPQAVFEVYLGVDIGSTSTKAVLMDSEKEVVVGLYTRTAGRPLVAVQNILRAIDEIQQKKEVRFNIVQCGTTGSGRKFIGKIIGADGVVDEITAHARAACQLNPKVDTIIEIGGQDAKFTTLKDGRVTSSTMNNVCAAGTGSFIEEQAAKLGCPVEEYSSRAENASSPMTSDRCTVFMERDMNHYLSEGYQVNEVLASALHSVRENYLLKVATEKNIGTKIFFQGATAKNKALVAAFEQRLGKPIVVSKFCHLTGALGTALILSDEHREVTSFVGVDLYKQCVPINSEVCELCTNHCKISVAEIGSSKVAYGFLCGRDYDTRSYVHRDFGAIDLFGERKEITRFQPQAPDRGPVVGLPAAVHIVDDLALWQKFFDLLGIKTLSSEQYKEGLKAGKNFSRAEFCAPMISMHGHVAWLLEQVDYVFMPIYLENKAKESRRQYCYYTQFLPSLASAVQVAGRERFLRPVIRYLYTSFHTKMQLYRMLQGIMPQRWSFLDVSMAYDKAVEFDQNCRKKFKAVLSERRVTDDDISVVFLGRPYTLFSPSLNCNIPGIFKDLGIDAFYQDMLSYEQKDVAALQPLLAEMHWEHAVKILEATEVVVHRKNLYPVFLTSFKCSPDSFTVEYFKSVMDQHGKPYLILELDEHDSSVGYETRIEAAVRAFRNHQAQQQSLLPVDYSMINPQLDATLQRKHVIFPNWDRITCALLVATLKREGFDARLMEETDHTIRQSLKHNTGQCIPLNAIAQGYMSYMEQHRLNPADCVLWLNRSTLACNIKLYPHHIKQILNDHGLGKAGVYVGELSLAEISLRAAMNGYFAYMIGGMLRRVACKIRPYEVEKGQTDKVLCKSIKVLSDAFLGKRSKEEVLQEIISHFEWIDTEPAARPKVAIFGDLYARDNREMNQDLVRFIEQNGGEVITTPYSEYAKMIAGSYFRKWFNEGKYLDLLAYRALLATMSTLEKNYAKLFRRILDEPDHEYTDDSAQILGEFNVSVENTGESMDNILKIHYIKKNYPDVSLFVQTSPALCCASLITEAMKDEIEKKTGVPVVSVTYDGTGGGKNDVIIPYLRYPRTDSSRRCEPIQNRVLAG